jgi:predicted phage tail protein|tara:strand:+ start:367 stop:1008 length:642 start_codon:yes stop_codon:yes gene_type:complete
MLRKIRLYGHLAEHCGQKVFEAVARTPAEAIRFLLCNFPELRSVMSGGHYTVAVGPHTLELGQSPEQIKYPLMADDDIRIIPVVAGAGVGDLLFAIAGLALVGFAIASGGASLGLTGFSTNAIVGVSSQSFLTTGAIAAGAGNLGLGLVLTGVAGLLSPTVPTPDIDNDPRNNFSFSGIQNVSREGVPIPIAYGEVIVGSVVVSAGLNVEELE